MGHENSHCPRGFAQAPSRRLWAIWRDAPGPGGRSHCCSSSPGRTALWEGGREFFLARGRSATRQGRPRCRPYWVWQTPVLATPPRTRAATRCRPYWVWQPPVLATPPRARAATYGTARHPTPDTAPHQHPAPHGARHRAQHKTARRQHTAQRTRHQAPHGARHRAQHNTARRQHTAQRTRRHGERRQEGERESP